MNLEQSALQGLTNMRVQCRKQIWYGSCLGPSVPDHQSYVCLSGYNSCPRLSYTTAVDCLSSASRGMASFTPYYGRCLTGFNSLGIAVGLHY